MLQEQILPSTRHLPMRDAELRASRRQRDGDLETKLFALNRARSDDERESARVSQIFSKIRASSSTLLPDSDGSES